MKLFFAPLSIFLALGCSSTRLSGTVSAGRYHSEDGRWSIAFPSGWDEGFDAYAYDARDENGSGFSVGNIVGPRWLVMVFGKERFREEHRDLDTLGDPLCLTGYQIGRPRGSTPDQVLHRRSTEVGGRPAELRVFGRDSLPADDGDVDDLFRQEHAPRELVVVYAVDQGDAFAIFRMEILAPYDAYRLRPRLRMALEPDWANLQTWMESFRTVPVTFFRRSDAERK